VKCGARFAYQQWYCDLPKGHEGEHSPGLSTKPSALIHGTNSTYCNHKCRCDPCRRAHNRYRIEWQAKQVALRAKLRKAK
jgi:hypothetical protein